MNLKVRIEVVSEPGARSFLSRLSSSIQSCKLSSNGADVNAEQAALKAM